MALARTRIDDNKRPRRQDKSGENRDAERRRLSNPGVLQADIESASAMICAVDARRIILVAITRMLHPGGQNEAGCSPAPRRNGQLRR